MSAHVRALSCNEPLTFDRFACLGQVHDERLRCLDEGKANLRRPISVTIQPELPHARILARQLRAVLVCKHFAERLHRHHAQRDIVGLHLLLELRNYILKNGRAGVVEVFDQGVRSLDVHRGPVILILLFVGIVRSGCDDEVGEVFGDEVLEFVWRILADAYGHLVRGLLWALSRYEHNDGHEIRRHEGG